MPTLRPAASPPTEDLGFRFSAMACDCEVRIAGLPEGAAEVLAAEAIAEVRRIQTKYSRYDPASVLSRINAAAGSGQPVFIDEETAHLLAFADQLHRLSGGLFDATSGILRRAWDFRARRKPTQAELEALLPLIDWTQVQWSPQAVALPRAGMELDFGGIGKEYAADRAATLLQQRGLRHGLINLGGDVRVIGPRPDGRPWTIGIQHPREPQALLASIELFTGALATSGDYERSFVDPDGRRHCHVLNPRTGWSVSAWRSVSVQAPTCLAAGALSTTAMLLGTQAAAVLDQPGIAVLAVDDHGRVHRSLFAS